MTTKNNVLLSCPFCDGKAEIERMGTNRVSMIIRCTDCGCSLESSETWIDEKSKWNTRTTNKYIEYLQEH